MDKQEKFAEIVKQRRDRYGRPSLTLLKANNGTWWRVETRHGRKDDAEGGKEKPMYVMHVSRGIETGSIIAWSFPVVRRSADRLKDCCDAHERAIRIIATTGTIE